MSSRKGSSANGASPSSATTNKPTKPGLASVGSEGKRRATAILEVLAGVRTPAQAAEALGVSVPRYYLLEQQALGGLVRACEPRAKGRVQTPQSRVAALEKELARMERECGRQQSLARAAQRAIGLPAVPLATKSPSKQAGTAAKGKKARRRRPVARALRAAAALAVEPSVSPPEEGAQPMAQEDRSSGDGSPGGVADSSG